MRRNIFVFSTSLNTDTDVKGISPVLNRCSKIKVWSVDLEDTDKVLRVECRGLSASDIIRMLNANGYTCKELEYLPSEIRALHHLLKIFFVIVCGFCCIYQSHAQVITDSLASDFRTFMAKNFTRYRTVNLYWETKMAHNYNFSLNGNEVEKMRKKNLHTFKVSTMIPVLKLKNVSLYTHLEYSRYQFDAFSKQDGTWSEIFQQSAYDYFLGGLNGSYYFGLFNKPVIISATVSADGWNKGFGMVHGSASVVMLLKNTERTYFSLGVMGRTLFNSMPVMPVISWWHRFNNPRLSVDITMPSQFYLRYELDKQRISAGASMSSENFYLKTTLEGTSATFYYSDAVLKPEIHYEYIINKHLYISAHVGISMVMKSGLYKKNRKGIKVKNEEGKTEVEPIVKQDRSPIPFFNVGISYSLFK